LGVLTTDSAPSPSAQRNAQPEPNCPRAAFFRAVFSPVISPKYRAMAPERGGSGADTGRGWRFWKYKILKKSL